MVDWLVEVAVMKVCFVLVELAILKHSRQVTKGEGLGREGFPFPTFLPLPSPPLFGACHTG